MSYLYPDLDDVKDQIPVIRDAILKRDVPLPALAKAGHVGIGYGLSMTLGEPGLTQPLFTGPVSGELLTDEQALGVLDSLESYQAIEGDAMRAAFQWAAFAMFLMKLLQTKLTTP